MEDSNEKSPGRPSKVARLLETYGLTSLGAELEQRWTDDGTQRQSLRELAQYFNRQLLTRQMQDVGMQALDGEVENIHRLLTDEEVSSADQTRIQRRLEREGIDVDRLQDDFVSYQAIRTYLQNYRNAEYMSSESDPIETNLTAIQQLRNRTAAISEDKIESLRDADHLDLTEFRVMVDVQVLCEECGTQYDVADIFADRGCDCGANKVS